jgi:hypothetical protein
MVQLAQLTIKKLNKKLNAPAWAGHLTFYSSKQENGQE